MELDEMKVVWTRMNQLLESQQRQSVQNSLNQKLRRVHSGLRPLFWGQVLQIFFGVAIILLAVGYWSANGETWYRFVCGIVLHIYGIVVIMMAGVTLGRIHAIDYSEPVVSIRKRVARLSSTYVLNGMMVGLPWWLLWVVVVVILAGYGGQDLLATRPLWVVLSAVVGMVGLIATWVFHKWAHQPVRAGFGKRLDENAAGRSLASAQKILNEIREFEQESSDGFGAVP